MKCRGDKNEGRYNLISQKCIKESTIVKLFYELVGRKEVNTRMRRYGFEHQTVNFEVHVLFIIVLLVVDVIIMLTLIVDSMTGW